MKISTLIKCGYKHRKVEGVKILKSKTTVIIESVTAGKKVIKQWRRVNSVIQGGTQTYITSIRLAQKVKSGETIDKCSVFCTCDDFKFTFYKALVEEGLSINLIPSSDFPKSKGTGRVRAIEDIGVCKHIIALAESAAFKDKMYAK